jgi:hypothetical protein
VGLNDFFKSGFFLLPFAADGLTADGRWNYSANLAKKCYLFLTDSKK